VAGLAQDLISQRDGRIVPIADADSFFGRLKDALEALRQSERPHPLSAAMAVALAKRYCRDDRYLLEWTELLAAEVAKIRAFVTGNDYPKDSPTAESCNGLVAAFLARSEILRRLCLVCGRWGTAEANVAVARAIRSLSFRSETVGGYDYWIELRDFPASMCLYWGLAGALARDDFATVRTLMLTTVKTASRELPLVSELPPLALGSIDWKFLKGLEHRKTPVSDCLFELLQREATDIALAPGEAEELFDRLEFLVSLEFAHQRLQMMPETGLWFWMPVGRYVWKRSGDGVSARLAAHVNLPADHAILKAGLLGGQTATATQAVDAVRKFIEEQPGFRW
jgi:hypothetical protein